MLLTNLTSKEIATHLSATAIDNFKIIGKTRAIDVELLYSIHIMYPHHTKHIKGNVLIIGEQFKGMKTYEI